MAIIWTIGFFSALCIQLQKRSQRSGRKNPMWYKKFLEMNTLLKEVILSREAHTRAVWAKKVKYFFKFR